MFATSLNVQTTGVGGAEIVVATLSDGDVTLGVEANGETLVLSGGVELTQEARDLVAGSTESLTDAIQLADAQTGQGHALSADGTAVAIAAQSHGVQVFDVESGTVTLREVLSEHATSALALSTDGSALALISASGSRTNKVVLFTRDSGPTDTYAEQGEVPLSDTGGIDSLDLSDDGRVVVFGDPSVPSGSGPATIDGRLTIVRIPESMDLNSADVQTISGFAGEELGWSVRVSGDGMTVGVASGDRANDQALYRLYRWNDVDSYERITADFQETLSWNVVGPPTLMAFSTDGSKWARLSGSGAILSDVFDGRPLLETVEDVASVTVGTYSAFSVDLSGDGSRVAVNQLDEVVVYDVDGSSLEEVTTIPGEFGGALLSADGSITLAAQTAAVPPVTNHVVRTLLTVEEETRTDAEILSAILVSFDSRIRALEEA